MYVYIYAYICQVSFFLWIVGPFEPGKSRNSHKQKCFGSQVDTAVATMALMSLLKHPDEAW